MATKKKGYGILPQWFMPSARARPAKFEQRIDLAPAATPPTYGDGRLIVFSYKVPKNQALVVQSFTFALWQRINIGGVPPGVQETYQLMTNAQVAGKVLFTPIVENQVQPFVDNVHNQATTLLFASNLPRLRSAGFTTVSENPEVDLLGNWFNPMMSFVVRSEQTLQVLFEVLPVSSGGTLEITDDPNVTQRVDFAGAYFAGQLMADADYSELAQEM